MRIAIILVTAFALSACAGLPRSPVPQDRLDSGAIPSIPNIPGAATGATSRRQTSPRPSLRYPNSNAYPVLIATRRCLRCRAAQTTVPSGRAC
jgi:hypothetical protein